jgi:hypothetical protein
MRLTLCPSCGYKILSADQADDLRAVQKLAQREKVHLAQKEYSECPKCKADLRQATRRVIPFDDKEAVREGLRSLDLGAKAIGAFRGAILYFNELSSAVPQSAEMMAGVINGAGLYDLDIRAPLRTLFDAVDRLQIRVANFRDELRAAIREADETKNEGQENGD